MRGARGGLDVTVVTGTVHDAPRAERTSRNGVNVIRVGSTAFDRSRLALRGFNYVSFVVLALVAALRLGLGRRSCFASRIPHLSR